MTFLRGMLTRRAGWLLSSGICWGLALGSKINALLFPLVIVPVLIPLVWDRSRRSASILGSLAVYPVIALSVLFLAWPYFWQDSAARLSRFWFYLTHWGLGGPPAWQATPVFNVLVTTPLPTLVFAIGGIIASVWTGLPFGRWATVTLLAWLLVPITRSSLPGVLNYDVIRRFLEFTPALAIFAGIGGASLIAWIARSGWFVFRRWPWVPRAAVLMAFLSPSVAVWRYFPYETSYYNQFVGGLGGAQSLKLHQSTDYWLTSYREGIITGSTIYLAVRPPHTGRNRYGNSG